MRLNQGAGAEDGLQLAVFPTLGAVSHPPGPVVGVDTLIHDRAITWAALGLLDPFQKGSVRMISWQGEDPPVERSRYRLGVEADGARRRVDQKMTEELVRIAGLKDLPISTRSFSEYISLDQSTNQTVVKHQKNQTYIPPDSSDQAPT